MDMNSLLIPGMLITSRLWDIAGTCDSSEQHGDNLTAARYSETRE